MIEGMAVRPLRRIADERGWIAHMMRADDPWFERFGEIYFSFVHPGAVKGWHLATEATFFYAVPSGTIKLVAYDDREGSTTRGELVELFVGEASYDLVRIPAGVWSGFKGVGTTTAMVANCSTSPHRPEAARRLDPHGGGIPYDWARKDR